METHVTINNHSGLIQSAAAPERNGNAAGRTEHKKMNKNNGLLRFWAKTSHDKDNPQLKDAFHPLICHLIDVAAVAAAMWEKVLPIVTKQRLAGPFGLKDDLDKAGKLIALLAGLHDLGKCSPPFALRGKNDMPGNQTRRLIELYKNTDCDCDDFATPSSKVPHGFVTAGELPPILIDKFKFPSEFAKNISEIIGGHHGIFAATGKLNKIKNLSSVGNEVWVNARIELFETLARLFEVDGDFSNIPNAKLDNASAMILAGFTSVADWIGSNADPGMFVSEIGDFRSLLSPANGPFDLDDYLQRSRSTASHALDTLGWTKWPIATGQNAFFELFPDLKAYNRRNLQAVCEDEISGQLNSPGVVVIEAPMGEGKTEAAMYLADAFNAAIGTRGIYFALPTQATSNQMFGRVEKFLKTKFKDDNVDVHLMLQHGHASISEEFEEKIKNFTNLKNISDDAEEKEKRKVSNVVAAEWFTYKKRGLLVPFGVGTIDQILLAALQTKHAFVRLFGLAHKTIIIDEVHAYDAYMSTLLERLLEWLAALGSPVIILSATLPSKKRDALIKAYLKGLEKVVDADALEALGDDKSYPRIAYATADMPEKTFHVQHLETSRQNTKTIHLEWKNEDDFVEELKLKLRDGGCAAIICNTVGKAQDIYTKLKDDRDGFFAGTASDGGPILDLLHARFRFCDRRERESRCLKRFGKPGTVPVGTASDSDRAPIPGTNAGEKHRLATTISTNGEFVNESRARPDMAVLISTQIIEQSLDLDFDIMISELAPADLLLQRAGRLQRHDRERKPAFTNADTGTPKPELWILKPPTNENGELLTNKNLPDFGVSGIIYDKHILLRSWLKLRNTSEISIPNDIEGLIEDVYDKNRDCFDDHYISTWDETQIVRENRLAEKRQKAKAVYLTDFDDDEFYDSINLQLDEDDPEKHSPLRAQTRDEEWPTVSLVLLTFNEAESLNLDVEPNRDASRFLINREVKISRPEITHAILANPDFKNPAWAKNSLLRHHRLIILNENKVGSVNAFSVILDDKKGVLFE